MNLSAMLDTKLGESSNNCLPFVGDGGEKLNDSSTPGMFFFC